MKAAAERKRQIPPGKVWVQSLLEREDWKAIKVEAMESNSTVRDLVGVAVKDYLRRKGKKRAQ